MRTVKFYCGQNNKTKKVEKSKIQKIVSKHFDGFSLIESTGFYKGLREKSVIVEVLTDKKLSDLLSIKEELRLSLAQESVLMTSESTNSYF